MIMSLSTHCPEREKVPKDDAISVADALEASMHILAVQAENRAASCWRLPDAFAAMDMAVFAVRRPEAAAEADRGFFTRMAFTLLNDAPDTPVQ